jgi:hypothetical protein
VKVQTSVESSRTAPIWLRVTQPIFEHLNAVFERLNSVKEVIQVNIIDLPVHRQEARHMHIPLHFKPAVRKNCYSAGGIVTRNTGAARLVSSANYTVKVYAVADHTGMVNTVSEYPISIVPSSAQNPGGSGRRRFVA